MKHLLLEISLFLLYWILEIAHSEKKDGIQVQIEDEITETTLRIIRWELHRYHETHPIILERECLMGDCTYDRALQIIKNGASTTEYWNFLICEKYGSTCPRNGKWGDWEPWSACSTRCGEGERLRTRVCGAPYPAYGGSTCKGKKYETSKCTFDEGIKCAPDPSLIGAWGDWFDWPKCVGTCGFGKAVRLRYCFPFYLPTHCSGYSTQEAKCPLPECEVQGEWSQWQSWMSCSTGNTCGPGMRVRRRDCQDPFPIGEGKDCIGPSSELRSCEGPPCEESFDKVVHLLPDSYIRYQPMLRDIYLNVYVRFLPGSSGGLIFQYSTKSSLQEAVNAGTVVITRNKLPEFVTVLNPTKATKQELKMEVQSTEEDYLYAYLASRDELQLFISVNGSDELIIPFLGVKHGKWNDFRVTLISDMVWARLNDGENIEARLADNPEQSGPIIATTNDTSYVGSVIASISNYFTDYAQSLLKPEARAIFTEFTGDLSLGAVRAGYPGFRGYISHLSVNYRPLMFKLKSKKEVKTLSDPVKAKGITLSTRGHRKFESKLTFFNSKERVELPLTAAWWGDFKTDDESEIGKKTNEVATFEIILEPTCADGDFLYIHGAKNRFTHWKLAVEDERKVRLVMSYFGEITFVRSGDDMRSEAWNKVVLQLVKRGNAKLVVNDKSYFVKMPPTKETDVPQPIIYIGGNGKILTNNKIVDDASDNVRKHMTSFTGYIYSLRQNNELYLIQDYPHINNFHMYSSYFMSRPYESKPYTFLPMVNGTDDLKAPTSQVEILKQHKDRRALHCISPVPTQAVKFPNISWYRNDVKVKEGSHMWTHLFTSAKTHSSSLYFGDSQESSRDHSGLYQCIITYYGRQYLIMTYAVSVLSDEIVHWATGGYGSFLRHYSSETIIFMAGGSIIGTMVLLLLMFSCIRYFIRKSRNKDKVIIPTKLKKKRRSKESNIQLTKRKSSLKKEESFHRRKRSSLKMGAPHLDEESTPLFGQGNNDYSDSDAAVDEDRDLLRRKSKNVRLKHKKNEKVESSRY